MFTKTIAAATASALLAGGAVTYADSTTSTTTKPKVPQTRGERQERVAARQAAFARELGVSAEQLRAANQALLKRRLDVRVAKGTLTVAQRSAVMACAAAPLTCDRTNLPVRGKKHGAKAKANASKRLDRRAANLAQALHLDKSKVLAALKERHKRG
jgi:hypothetical protein